MKKTNGASRAPATIVWAGALLLFWYAAAAVSLPTPTDMATAWLDLVQNGGLLHELLVSVRLNVEAVAISALLSIGLAYMTVENFAKLPINTISKFRFFGMAGFSIIFTRIFGGGHALKVAMLVFGMSVFFLTSMIDIVNSTTSEELDHARSLRMGKWRSIYEVIILGKADQAFDSLRQNAAIGWMMLTMVEGLVRFEGGVGLIMLNESKYRKLDAVFAVQLTVLAVGIIQDRLIVWAKSIFCPYSKLKLENK